MDLLVFLASAEGRVVSKNEIIDTVWKGRFIAEATLTRSIADLRRALGDSSQRPQYIETIAKRGYRLVAPVTGLAQPEKPRHPEPCLIVLPFNNLGPESDRYFSDGLTEEIIN